MARYLEKERDDVVAINPPKPIKSKEKGDYTHFRFEEPDKFDKIRVPDWAEKVADSVVDGAKVKMGRLEDSGDWVPQSVMIPKDVANAEDASEIVSKIGSNPHEDVRVPFDVEVVKEPDRIENPHGEDDVGVPIEGVEADGRIGVGRGMTTDVYDDTNWRQVRNLQNTTPGMKKRIEQRYANRLGEDRVDLVDDRLFVRDNPPEEDELVGLLVNRGISSRLAEKFASEYDAPFSPLKLIGMAAEGKSFALDYLNEFMTEDEVDALIEQYRPKSNPRENLPQEWVKLDTARLKLNKIKDEYDSREEAHKSRLWGEMMNILKSLSDGDEFVNKIIRKVNRGQFESAHSDMLGELSRRRERYDIEALRE